MEVNRIVGEAKLTGKNTLSVEVGDTTADRQHFGKMLLVFGCIGSDFCKKIYQRFALSRVTHKGELRLRDKKF